MTEEIAKENKNISIINIEDEMRSAYLSYAMSVIIGRALPDVRDGLKPVHRRVLYAMYDLGNTHTKAFKKSARVVGDVIGKYHPHGDTAVYDTLVRMAQDFSLRYPLIDGQGNFGSVDGDAPAAMRYTEIRMQLITDEMLADLEKETVDHVPNYDESLMEPRVLPAKIPNLLINGSSGIAVGMATNIPPHNLTEVIEATIAVINNPNIEINEILNFIKGPDFPTAGSIMVEKSLKDAYFTGRGSVIIRAKAEIEPWKKDRERIIISEIPYQVNKAKLIEKIAELVRDKKIEGVSDLRDESDRKGMRVVIELKRNENSNVILNRLYRMTALQERYSIILLAIHNNRPKVFNIKEILWAFIEHRKEVVTRRTIFELKKAEARAHILEGLKKAVDNLDEVIKLIKAAPSPIDARADLMMEFDFSEIQAQAILDMRLHRLTGLEREKISNEYLDVLNLVKELKDILSDEKHIYRIIKEELTKIKEKYGDKRKTEIIFGETTAFEVEDLISDEEALVSITNNGYIKRTDPDLFRRQGRGGKGVRGVSTGDQDFVTNIYNTTTLSYLLCLTNKGKLYWLKVYKIPEAGRAQKGKAIVNLIELGPGESIRAILPVKEFRSDEYIVMITKSGIIKKTALSEFKNIRSNGIKAILIQEDDELVAAKNSFGNNNIFLSTKNGISICFEESTVRSMGRNTKGVTGIRLKPEDSIVSMEIISSDNTNNSILSITEKGYGKRTSYEEYRIQGRAGMGVKNMKVTERNGFVMGSRQIGTNDDVILVSNKGQMIRVNVNDISEIGRNTQGVRVMNMASGEMVVSFELVAEKALEEENVINTKDVNDERAEVLSSNEGRENLDSANVIEDEESEKKNEDDSEEQKP